MARKVTNVGFANRITHRVQVDLRAVLQSDSDLEVDRPALLNGRRRLSMLANRFLLQFTAKLVPLVQIAPNASLAGQP
jgi:hypothetical protein